MSAVSETIVREYFELHGFFVRQQRKYIMQTRREDDEIDFFVLNPRAQGGGELPFVLASANLAGIPRAVVVVKGWHTETFSPSLLASASPSTGPRQKIERAMPSASMEESATTVTEVRLLSTGKPVRVSMMW